jgi:hypothetical protein
MRTLIGKNPLSMITELVEHNLSLWKSVNERLQKPYVPPATAGESAFFSQQTTSSREPRPIGRTGKTRQRTENQITKNKAEKPSLPRPIRIARGRGHFGRCRHPGWPLTRQQPSRDCRRYFALGACADVDPDVAAMER